jgi:hypothetical protein
VLVLRSSACAVLCVSAACVGTNPDWDRPADVAKNAEESGESGGSQSESESESEATGDASSGAPGDEDESTTDGSTSDGGSSDDAPACEPGRAICAGECTDIATEKKACGIDCIDCTTIYGSDARCKGGVCEPKDD